MVERRNSEISAVVDGVLIRDDRDLVGGAERFVHEYAAFHAALVGKMQATLAAQRRDLQASQAQFLATIQTSQQQFVGTFERMQQIMADAMQTLLDDLAQESAALVSAGDHLTTLLSQAPLDLTAAQSAAVANRDAALALDSRIQAALPAVGSAAALANAGPNQSVSVGAVVTLDGSLSTDPAGGGLVYAWAQMSGSPVPLSDATVVAPTFTPAVADTYVFQLIVSDGIETSLPASVTVTAA